MDSTEVCGCGRPVRYMTKSGNACNKYGRCRGDSTKTDQISSGLVAHIAAFKEALNGTKGDLDAWLECNDESEVRQAIFGIISDVEAIIAAKDAEIARLNAALDAKITICGDETIRKQAAAIKLARDALKDIRNYADVLAMKRAQYALDAIESLKID